MTTSSWLTQWWPRLFVGSLASIRLLLDTPTYVAAMFFAHPQFPTNIPPEEQGRLAEAIICWMLAITTLLNLIALYAVSRKSVTATKISLAAWGFEAISLTLLVTLLTAMAIASETFRASLAHLRFNSIFLFTSFLAQMLYGWSLVVYLRDLRGQPRDAHGFLVKDGEKGVVKTSTSNSSLTSTSKDGAIRL
ncbi:hypothetical protein BGX34_009195 [Mortierella sp. NVP85]|nr:hypothetical protein BGX34_009195 [Mortierella sp. NVP85]